MGAQGEHGLNDATYRRLLAVAERAAHRHLWPSAGANLADEVAAQAVWEYWRVVERGEDVRNDEAFVTDIATKRARDARDAWSRRRDLRYGHGAFEAGEMLVPDDALGRPPSWLPRSDDVWRQRLESLIRSAGDELDAEIGIAVFLDGEEPADIADRLGLAEKTVRNRMTAIRKAVRGRLEGSS